MRFEKKDDCEMCYLKKIIAKFSKITLEKK